MYCSKCGNRLLEDARFCPKCGTKIMAALAEIPMDNELAQPKTSTLITYFGYAKELEVHRYTLQQAVNKIELQIRKLAIPRSFSQKEKKTLRTGTAWAACGALIGWLITIFAMWFKAGRSFGDVVFELIFNLELLSVPVMAIPNGGVTGAIVGAFGIAVGLFADKTNEREYNAQKKQDAARVAYEQTKVVALRKQQAELGEQIKKVEAVLNGLYALDVIYPKYRELVAVVTIHEYLQSGRCTQLAGANGAYNLYESEKRQDIIICDMNRIISLLEEIRNIQYALYEAVQESNDISYRICRQNEELLASNKALENNTEKTAYQAKVATSYSKISAYIDVFSM